MMKTETEMREEEVPSPKSAEELMQYVNGLVDRQHDYGTCVYAMSHAAVAAFNFVASKLGVTGFQASCADLDIIRRTRRIKGPFMLIKGEDALYPQYDIEGKLREALESWKDWLGEEAAKKLKERNTAHPGVMRHWIRLASLAGKNGFDADELLAKADFLENEFTEAFVEKNHEQFKRFRINEVYLFRGAGDISKATECKEGCSWRINLPVSLNFSYTLHGIKIEWSVDTEPRGSNGTNKLNIDFKKLGVLLELATNANVKTAISDYVNRAKKAITENQ